MAGVVVLPWRLDTSTGHSPFWLRLTSRKVPLMLSVTSRFGSGLLVALVMLLAFALATPSTAAAADPVVFKTTRPAASQTAYNWMFDYFKKSTQKPCIGGYIVDSGPATSWLPCSKINQPVSTAVRPDNWYLDNYKTGGALSKDHLKQRLGMPAMPKPGNPVIGGKIVEPGKTLVLIPEAKKKNKLPWKQAVKGSTGLLGLATVGMGGVADIPEGAETMYANKGVTSGCIADKGTCTEDEYKKILDVNMCAHTYGECERLGGKTGLSAVPIIAMLQDLWRALTGQSDKDTIPVDGLINPKGCYINFLVEPYSGTGAGDTRYALAKGPVEVVKANEGRPGTTAYGQWNADCLAPGPNLTDPGVAEAVSTCLDSFGRNADPVTGASYGTAQDIATTNFTQMEQPDGTFKPVSKGACTKPEYTLFSVAIKQKQTQAAHDTATATYHAVRPAEFMVQAPDLHTAENSTTSTTVNCITPKGTTYTHTTTISGVGATPEPICPQGSTYDSHKTTSSPGAGAPTRTIDEDGVDPAAKEKWPNQIAAGGAALSVILDGQPCTASRAECENWPAIAARTPSRVACDWGGDIVAISNCYLLSDAYKSETGMIFDPVSGTWVAVDSFGTPVASNPQPWNPVNPAPSPGASPGTGTGTAPGTGGSPFPTTGQPSPNDSCGGAWNWNPFDWVGKQLQCAFIPKTDVKTRIATMQGQLEGTAPFSWIMPGALAGPGDSGCPNWTVTVGSFSENVVCDKGFTNAIIGARDPIFVLVSTAMVWPLIRSLWYASIPILRVTPTGSK